MYADISGFVQDIKCFLADAVASIDLRLNLGCSLCISGFIVAGYLVTLTHGLVGPYQFHAYTPPFVWNLGYYTMLELICQELNEVLRSGYCVRNIFHNH